MVPVESNVVTILYWRKWAGKLGEDGKMFEIELIEGQTINNDIIQGLALEETGWGGWEMWLLEERICREFKRSSVSALKAIPRIKLFQLLAATSVSFILGKKNEAKN